jgi:hypothetical protein
VVRQDLDEANAHVVASTGVHGISGSVVGTSDNQNLTNKTITNPVLAGTATGSGAINTSGAITTTAGVTGGSVTTGGAVAATGAATAASFTANGDGKVTGVHVPKTYATEAAATAAISSPTVGTTVWLTAPTTGPVGLFAWNGTAWLPYVLTGQRLQYSQTAGGQALTNAVFVAITGYAAADVDTFGGSTFNAATGVWTCPATGNYEISGQVSATGAVAVRLIAAIFKNGSSIYSSWQSGAPTFLATATLVPKEFALTASDQITLQAQPNAAGISTGNSNGNGPFLRIKRV